MDLFEHAAKQDAGPRPLAEAVRPQSLDEVVGQAHLVGPGRSLRQAIERDRMSSVVLWGPPGTGKTTLARVVAAHTGCHFEPFSAVLGGVKEIRAIVEAARQRFSMYRTRTILFIDEIHRFNKGQQDALLPHVEDGTVTLGGATTENPSFELNAALLSRARVLVLEPLGAADLEGLLRRAWDHPVRAERWPEASIDPDALAWMARIADGDARRALNALEAALEHAADGDGRVTAEGAARALDRKLLRHDKSGDAHYDVVSAFIKSMRGSDPDAAAYWLARLLEAGEDPPFLLRRMVIFASEDVGLADPRALVVAVAALDAFRAIGLPEGRFALYQAATYLALAPKSNTVLRTMSAAEAAVRAHGNAPVPLHLRNAETALDRRLGHGKGYLYPHDAPDGWVEADYLPEGVRGAPLFEPVERAEEGRMAARLRALRGRSGRDPAASG